MSIMKILTDIRRIGLAGAVILLSAACDTDSLLDVANPDIVNPGALETAVGASAQYAGAVGDFAVAHDGGGGPTGSFGMLGMAGLFTDQFRFGGTPPEVRQLDLTDVVKENSFFRRAYLALHRARGSTERAAGALANTGTGGDSRVGEMWALNAAAAIVLGEHFCSGSPISSVTIEGEITYGPNLTTDQVMDAALASLTAASGSDGGDSRIQNLIAVLRGRAMVNKGEFAAAAGAVAAVPTSFAYDIQHDASNTRTQNSMKSFIFDFDYMSVSDGEGGAGLDFATAGDPRVVTNFTGPSRFDSETPHYQFLKYDSWGSSVTLASGVEARLIEAEAALQAGDIPGWLAGLDAGRAPYGMAAAVDPGDAGSRGDLMIRERAFALFSTAHRLGDMRRAVRQYGNARNAIYPSGEYHKDDLIRGTQASFILPANEENNPEYSATVCNPDAA